MDRAGDQFGDADDWAHKGVLLTRINVGYGVIDLFSTHTYWGGSGILKSRTPSDAQRANDAAGRAGRTERFLQPASST